jgi:glycosyltransferase involved in cell wall biosynthesis
MITIITPSYNRAGMIETAIQSVLSQDYPQVEHIIIDGGSTDGTLDVLKKYPQLKVVSEPDTGMYDALNKGLDLATGEIITFLNSDDYYAPDVFSKIANIFADKNIDAVVGLAGIVYQTEDTHQDIVLYQPGQGDSLLSHTILEMPIFNAYFFSKHVFHDIGKFNTRYQIAADRDFMIRFASGNFKTCVVDYPVYYYLQHSDSMTIDYTDAKYRAIVDEHLFLSKSYIESHIEYPRQLVESLVELRTRETIRVCAHCLRQKDFSGAWFYFKEGILYNPLWIIRFLKHAFIHPIRQKMGLPYESP